MTKLVYPTTTCKLQASNGLGYQLIRGTAWDAEDPLVKEHPEHFSEHPVIVFRSRPIREAEVERATAAPGERRRGGTPPPPDTPDVRKATESW